VSDYSTVDKTGWFIQKMTSGWFSRPEIVDLAVAGFPSIPRKTLDGTIGWYWSDSVNPKWGTYKAIEARGLKVVERAGQRHVVTTGEAATPNTAKVSDPPPRSIPNPAKLASPTAGGSDEIRQMWNGSDPDTWQRALDRYRTFVKPSNLALENEMDRLDPESVRKMGPEAWYKFLLEKYFRWTYTAPNRYASTTNILRSYAANNELAALHSIKERLFAVDRDNIQQCLAVASSIRGLGIAGASGLLAILFPGHFGTVDQFAVKALAKIPDLPEAHLIAAMNPESLKLNEGTVVIRIMRRKSEELNRALSTTDWTPRKVDMVLWACAR
jgi:hypothetical protein